ncbi:ABC transporter permease [Hominifimenecus sp. rT4P-3]|uniref:ABC transporter permease n=1 Tax=Hominifimenecus sp. rT4P-3 TaxID=3242979 RepID=UPI003DA2BA02
MKKGRRLKEIWRRFKKNRLAMVGLVVILIVVVLSILAPLIAPYGLDEQNAKNRLLAPCAEHLFGTDNYGRDILTRVLYGGRISLTVAIGATAISGFFGIILGSIAGFFGGKVDNAIMRVLDVFMALPATLTAIAISTVLGTGITKTMLALGLATVPRFARIVRGPILSLRTSEFIEAAQSIDVSTPKIIFKHIIPNVLSPIIVQATLYIATTLMVASSLSFVGLGVQPPSAEWGAMITAGRAYIKGNWWLITFPGLAILISVFSMNVLGDGLRDALDPRLKN